MGQDQEGDQEKLPTHQWQRNQKISTEESYGWQKYCYLNFSDEELSLFTLSIFERWFSYFSSNINSENNDKSSS